MEKIPRYVPVLRPSRFLPSQILHLNNELIRPPRLQFESKVPAARSPQSVKQFDTFAPGNQTFWERATPLTLLNTSGLMRSSPSLKSVRVQFEFYESCDVECVYSKRATFLILALVAVLKLSFPLSGLLIAPLPL